MNFIFFGELIIFEFFIMLFGFQLVDIEGFGVYWLDVNIILWDVFEMVLEVKFYYLVQVDLESIFDEGINGI